jgi:hypothetical protein
VILPKTVREWIKATFKSSDLAGLQSEIQKYYQREGFTYTLKPGRILSFQEFIQEKKTGFCSHYASATAMILRVKGIPVRLVSGFMGGNYNSYASFYLVTQNDAHVWLEAHENGKWTRLDPTMWIAPERLTLGGEAFLGTVGATNTSLLARFNLRPRWLREASMWINQWDFKFYQWLEEMDYYGQEAILSRFKFRRQWLYTLAPFMIVLFVGLFMWQARRREETLGLKVHEKTWKEFMDKVQGMGLELLPVSVRENERQIENWDHPERENVGRVWNELVSLSFNGERDPDWKPIRKKIRKL